MNAMLQLFVNAGDGVWAVDGNRRIIFWNKAASDILGFENSEVISRSCVQVLGGCDVHGVPFCRDRCEVLANAQLQEPVDNFDLVVNCKDGKHVLVNVSTLPVPSNTRDNESPVLVHLFRLLDEVAPHVEQLRIRLLGPTTVQHSDGSVVAGKLWRRLKVRALLAILAMRRGRPVHRQQLVEMLWPDLSYEAALRNLNTTVYNLRRSLEPGLSRGADSRYIHYENDCYALADGDRHWLDVDVFEESLKQARRQERHDLAVTQYEAVLELYRGTFQSDLGAVGSWPFGERDRLRGLYLSALEELGQLHLSQNRYLQAKEMFTKAVSVDPCRESAYQSLMRLALKRNDLAAVVAYYQRLVDALHTELALRPTEETRQLYEAAIRHR